MAFYSSISAPGQQGAPDTAYFMLGVDASGVATTLTGGSSNGLGTSVLLGTAPADANEITLVMNVASVTVRYRVRIGIGSGMSPLLVTDFVLCGIISAGNTEVRIPVKLAAGDVVYAQVAASSASSTMVLALRCRKKQALEFAGFVRADGIAVDSTTTRASTVTVPMAAAGSTTFTPIVATTGADYGGFVAYTAVSSTLPSTGQGVVIDLAKGAASSEVVFDSDYARISNAIQVTSSRVASTALASGGRLSARIIATTPGSDVLLVGVLGLVP